VRHAVFVPSAGVLDLHALHGVLTASARSAGGEIRIDSGVAALMVEAGRAIGVELEDGTRIAGTRLIFAYLAQLQPWHFEPEHRKRYVEHAGARERDAPGVILARATPL
jgi:phytoene dehydrogenase-like protein